LHRAAAALAQAYAERQAARHQHGQDRCEVQNEVHPREMRTTLNTIAVLVTLAALTACGSGKEQADSPENEVAAERVRAMEDSLYAKPGMDRKGAQALIDVYLLYAKVHPLDSLTPEYLFRAAGMKGTLGDPVAGIDLYDRIIRDFPAWRKLPDTYYLKAFTIDNGLRQRGEAE